MRGLFVVFALAFAFPAAAQTYEQSLRAKNFTIVIFSIAGSAYDVYARALGRHIGDHLPGKPTVIMQQMTGAGGLKTVDYLYRIAPKDGTVIGTIGRGLPFEPMLGKNDINFDPLRMLWLGSMNREPTLAMSWGTSPVKSLADLRQKELLVPGTGAGADSEIMPLAFNALAGTKFKVINGYADTSLGALAMERGELDGLAYWSWTSLVGAHPDWIRDNKLNLLFHTGEKPLPFAPAVPTIRDAIANPVDKAALEFLLAREIIGRPFVAPPDLPADRAQTLRDAFVATLKDPDFLADAARANIETELVSPEEVDALLRTSASAPKAVHDRVKVALNR